MENQQDYVKDIAEIRTMMERSSRFLSLSGWAGIMAGIYALVASYIAWSYFRFRPEAFVYDTGDLSGLIMLACLLLLLAVGTAIILSGRKADKRGERIWNATSRRLLINMGVPLVAGGILLIVFYNAGFGGLLIPVSMIFYGISLNNAGINTFNEVRFLGLIQIVLGLISALAVPYSMICWAAGFGIMHIIYGIYIHIRYER